MVERKAENCGFDGEGKAGTVMARYIGDSLFPHQLGAVEKTHMGLKEEENAPTLHGLYSTTFPVIQPCRWELCREGGSES
jgi:hypothetical protein